MKLLQVINRLNRGGGAEKFVLDLSMALNAAGAEVEILSLCRPQNSDLLSEAEAMGITHQTLSDGNSPSWKNLLRLRRKIKRGGYDVVHVHLFPALYMAALAAIGLKNKPKLIYTEHSTSNKRRRIWIFKLIEHYVYGRGYDRIVGISSEVAAKLSAHARIKNLRIVHNGVDIGRIEKTPTSATIRDEFQIPAKSSVITMVGRFVPGKDYATLIESMAYLPKNVNVLCVGDGPLRQTIERLTLRMPYATRVHFTGLRSDVIQIIKASDVIVLSTEHEGFSISMLEAMACGKPFVASAVPGISDVVGSSALLFDYRNSPGLASQIMKLLSDTDFYEEMSNRSRAFAAAHDMNEIATQYLAIYGE